MFICEMLYNYGNLDDKAYCRRLLHSFSIDVLCERETNQFENLNWELKVRALWMLGNLDEDQSRAKFCFEECIKQLETEIALNHW